MPTPFNPHGIRRSVDLARLVLRHWDRGWFDEQPEGAPREEGDDDVSLATDLERLGPTFVKLGQTLATRPDVAPPAVREDLSRLHGDVEPVDVERIEARIEEELGAPVRTLFQRFEERPLGSASLAQVHRAWLRDGTPVAVKVLRPGALEQVEDDLSLLRDIADWLEEHSELEARYGLCSTLREFDQVLRRELDYRDEARNLRHIAELTERYGRVRVPAVIDDYSTRRVLTMEHMDGTPVGKLSPMARLERDLEPAARELFRAYLDQALVHGFVHADPHPGNVLVLDDGSLALIDLGMVTVVPEEFRAELVQLTLAAARGDGSAAARIAERVGEPLEGFASDRFMSRVATELATHRGAVVGEHRLGDALLAITRVAGECGLRVPSALALLGKTLLNLEHVGTLLAPGFDPAAEVEAYTPELIAARVGDQVDPATLLRKTLEAKAFADKLPHRLDQIVDRLATGDFQVRMHVVGEERIVGGLARVANRIAHALVLAALIVGAALGMLVDTDTRLFGYPALAVVLFLLAVLGGVHLLWLIARDDAGE